MKSSAFLRPFFLILTAGLLISACGDDGSSEKEGNGSSEGITGGDENKTGCIAGETLCNGNFLLTCGSDGKFVQTQCGEKKCGKDGNEYRCLPQNNEPPQATHDCEADWSKCEGDVRYTCDAEFHWQKSEDCAGSSKVCKQEGNTAACEQTAAPQPQDDCTDGEVACGSDDNEIMTCVKGKWNTNLCPEGQVCVSDSDSDVHCEKGAAEPECNEGAVECEQDGKLKKCENGEWVITTCPEGQVCKYEAGLEPAACRDITETKNALVNISIQNTSSKAITITPKFRFVLSTEGTGSEYPYNRTDAAVFAEGNSLTIESGATKTFNKVEIPGDSKQYEGQHFSRKDELGDYSNNVLLYDLEGNSSTIVPEMIDPATIFKDGGTYNIVYNSKTEPQQPQTGNVFVNILIKNNSAEAITITPKFRFVLSTEGTGSPYPYNRTDAAVFAEGNSLTIESGATQTFNKVEIPGDSKQYVGQHFARKDELGDYPNNVLLYDLEGNSSTIVPEMMDPATLFKDGVTYSIVYDSKTGPQQPQTGNVSVNISIKNDSTKAITLTPKFRFVLSTEGTGSPYPYNRTDAAVFAEGSSLTIDGGVTKTFNNVEIPGDSKQYVGQHFARKDELGTHVNNVLLYDGEGDSSTIVPEMMDPATLFKDGESYNIVYK